MPPLLDVRAPTEFKTGQFPNSVNLPILTDDERAQVGTVYKQQGQEAAVATGHRLVSGETRAARIESWRAFCAAHPDAMVMCWRGGQRSGLTQQWLADIGIDVPRVDGGFKALRNACLATLSEPQKSWWLISGRTGSAKTVLIQSIDQSIDLEGLANHRGSAFGRRITPQPTPVTFENALAIKYLQHDFDSLIVEDESRTIGRIGLPTAWHQQMQAAPVALVEASFDERVEHIHQEYVLDAQEEYSQAGLAIDHLQRQYEDAAQRIQRRLGGLRFEQLTRKIQEAFQGSLDHREWISYLLREYYDPMYDFQLQRKSHRIAFQGNAREVTEFLQGQP